MRFKPDSSLWLAKFVAVFLPLCVSLPLLWHVLPLGTEVLLAADACGRNSISSFLCFGCCHCPHSGPL